MEKRILDERRYLGPAEPACSKTDVEFAVDAMNVILAMTYCLLDFFRKAIGQPNGDELNSFWRIEVRQIAP